MRKFNAWAFILSLLVVLVAFSAVSISSVAENDKWALASINPWNGVEGVAFVISYFLRTGLWSTYLVTIGLALMLWFGIYKLMAKIASLFKAERAY